ncbi:MAG: PA0069 family radical SAM protein [Gammaproteobacteria bacterium]|nr:PA0069 family radical SAM protein [Gammaproteobacteria bacterium]
MTLNRKQFHKGRGAVSNPAGRFDTERSELVDDGWSATETVEFPSSSPKTSFYPDLTKNLIATNTSPDIPFDRSINAYKGCEHGCVYCFARPTHSYLDLSPGLDFETKIFYKTDVVARLEEALDHPRYACSTIAMGTNTDPYQPAEKRFRITRQVLETLLAYRHPVSITTKGSLVLRDLDLLRQLAEQDLVSVMVSITTLDNALKTKLEPRTASPAARLRVVEAMAEAGVPVAVMAAPMIPVINDHELEAIVEAAANAGARTVRYILLRLPFEVKDLFREWLDEHYPLKAEHVMNRVRDMRGGRDYRSEWGTRMRGEGAFAELLAKRHAIATRKHGVDADMPAQRTDLFRPRGQMELF